MMLVVLHLAFGTVSILKKHQEYGRRCQECRVQSSRMRFSRFM